MTKHKGELESVTMDGKELFSPLKPTKLNRGKACDLLVLDETGDAGDAFDAILDKAQQRFKMNKKRIKREMNKQRRKPMGKQPARRVFEPDANPLDKRYTKSGGVRLGKPLKKDC